MHQHTPEGAGPDRKILNVHSAKPFYPGLVQHITSGPILALAVEGPLSARCPASALQIHPNAKVFLDVEAGSALELASYYHEVQAQRASSVLPGLPLAFGPQHDLEVYMRAGQRA